MISNWRTDQKHELARISDKKIRDRVIDKEIYVVWEAMGIVFFDFGNRRC